MNQQQMEKELERLHHQGFAWALRCCFENKEAAEEVLQNTYLKILEGKARYLERSAFKTWFFSVIRFTAIDYYQTNKKWQKVTGEMNDLLLELPGTDNIDLDRDAVQQGALFLRALSQLSPQQSNLLHLVFYQNCTIQEAAQIMNIQLGTARTHYKRGKRQLRECLLKAGFLKDV